MNTPGYAALAAAGFCGALASVLLTRVANVPVIPLNYVGVGGRLIALSVYGLGFFLYGYALRSIGVSVAYPIMVAISVMTLMAYASAHGEAVSAKNIVGAVLVLAGVALLAQVKS
jgi:small multidrug resistance pump